MSKNIILGCSLEFEAEIAQGLEALGKQGYTVHVRDPDEPGRRLLTFTLGESEQTLGFGNDEWRKAGVVSSAIVEHLNI